MIDLRSDFMSRPTPEMIEAMIKAAQSNCSFGLREDPYQKRLERSVEKILEDVRNGFVTIEGALKGVFRRRHIILCRVCKGKKVDLQGIQIITRHSPELGIMEFMPRSA